jgi:hypothetical protein
MYRTPHTGAACQLTVYRHVADTIKLGSPFSGTLDHCCAFGVALSLQLIRQWFGLGACKATIVACLVVKPAKRLLHSNDDTVLCTLKLWHGLAYFLQTSGTVSSGPMGWLDLFRRLDGVRRWHNLDI